MRQAEQVAVRPAVALLVLHHLEGQVVGLALDIPAADRVAEASSPTAQSIHIICEVEKVRSGAAHLRQVGERLGLGLGVSVRGDERQGKDGWVVLRRAAAVADLDDAVHGANPVGFDAADEGVVVLLHEITLGDVVGSALGTEDQEPVEAGPVIDLPGVTPSGVGHLGRARDGLRLRGVAAVEQTGVVDGHSGLLSG